MSDRSDQAELVTESPFGAMPMTGFSPGKVPSDYLALVPEDWTDHDKIALCVIHPPMAEIMSMLPEALLSSVILPALEQADFVLRSEEATYQLHGAKTDDGLFLLFISRSV
jgi:hypothetical protein